jgi:hypothetical protein
MNKIIFGKKLLFTLDCSDCTVLYCTTLHCTALHCTALHCTALHCTALHCTALHFRSLCCTALHCTVLHCTDILGTVLYDAVETITVLYDWMSCGAVPVDYNMFTKYMPVDMYFLLRPCYTRQYLLISDIELCYLKSIVSARVRTCQRESDSRTFQGHSRPCYSMYQQIQALNTEEKALEISKMWRWIVQIATCPIQSIQQNVRFWMSNNFRKYA